VEVYTVRLREAGQEAEVGHLESGTSLLHYTVVDQIGQGGIDQVYLAEATRLKRSVAIKILPLSLRKDPEMVARLHTEAEAAARLNHPSIATIYAVEEDEGLVFIVMEYIDGETLWCSDTTAWAGARQVL
jgi:eukaryotic-like serine/threonine-protein kinase